jgi:hypothetical protein
MKLKILCEIFIYGEGRPYTPSKYSYSSVVFSQG